MALAYEDIYQLVDGTLDRGLPYVCTYIEKLLGRPIIITDCDGLIHYPNLPLSAMDLDESFVTLPNLEKKEYLYSQKNNCLYYSIPCNDSQAFIIVKNLPTTKVSITLITLKQVKLAIKCYFSKLYQTNKNLAFFEQEMYEYLIGRKNANITDILTLANYHLPAETPYYAIAMLVHDIKSPEQKKALLSYSREYLKYIASDAFLVSGPRFHFFILPAETKTLNIESLNNTLKNNYKVALSFGQSTPHPLADLRRSCDEARIALYYPQVMGIQTEMQSFADLGNFIFLFSQDIETVKQFCWHTLQPLLNYDKKYENVLLRTLTELVNSNFNLKETAQHLFIHINTLYYRINKIEQLLDTDLSLMSTRVNLFTALKAWNLLHLSGFWDDSSDSISDAPLLFHYMTK